jgi:H/ACA ribonucleoprotein complex subunit 4
MRLHKELDKKELDKTIKSFIWKIQQLPPVRSRVKRAIREREVFYFKILEIAGKDVLFETEVQAGTYIRKLISDLGDKIGGAHTLELRRTRAGVFSELDKNFVNLYDFEKAVSELEAGNEEILRKMLIPAEEAIKKVLPVVQVKENAVKSLLTGKPLFKQDIIGKLDIKEGRIAVFFGDKFIEVAKIFHEGDIIAKPEFVYN